jgi:hypothetical protein
MRRVLVSLMCHPDRTPKITVPDGDGYDVMVNRTPNYADAYRFAIGTAVSSGMDLVTADTDGYHPEAEILKLATGSFYGDEAALVLPFRDNLGIQSKSFSLFYSLIKRRRIRDATSGLVRLSYPLLSGLPKLESRDMTVHIEILNLTIRAGAKIEQYRYTSGANDRAASNRTANYQWKLLGAIFR